MNGEIKKLYLLEPDEFQKEQGLDNQQMRKWELMSYPISKSDELKCKIFR